MDFSSVFFYQSLSALLAFRHHAPSLTITDQIKRIVTKTLNVTAFPSQGQNMTPVAHSSIKDGKVHHFPSPAQTWGLLYPAPGSSNSGIDSDLPYSMAAAEDVAHASDCRTTWPPTESAPHLLPPGRRKFPFETQAADAVGGTAVIAEHLLNQSDEACGQEQQAPGPQPCRLVTMTSVVKTVYTLQPSCVLSSGLPADAQTRATFKSQLPVKSKEVDVSRPHSGASENDVTKIIKPRRENGQVKATDTSRRNLRKSYKPLSKQKSEEELKDKNQLLEAVNKQLHQKLIETQGELKDLTQKVELLEKFQDNCLAILESKGLNPGSETLASQQDSTADHVDSMLLLQTLQDELKLFNETAKKQMEELQALKVKLKMKEEERAQFLEQQTLCSNQVNDFTTALEEMEQLLEI